MMILELGLILFFGGVLIKIMLNTNSTNIKVENVEKRVDATDRDFREYILSSNKQKDDILKEIKKGNDEESNK